MNFIYLFIIVIFCFEVGTLIVYGGFVAKEVAEVYMNLDETQLTLNKSYPHILNTNCFIAPLPFSIFSKYYINGLGTVPRWSKLHRRINEYYAIAAKNAKTTQIQTC